SKFYLYARTKAINRIGQWFNSDDYRCTSHSTILVLWPARANYRQFSFRPDLVRFERSKLASIQSGCATAKRCNKAVYCHIPSRDGRNRDDACDCDFDLCDWPQQADQRTRESRWTRRYI